MWQREMPKREGTYYTRTRDGEVAGLLTVCRHPGGGFFNPEHPRRSKLTGQLTRGSEWKGWWWSEPLPPHPPFDKESE